MWPVNIFPADLAVYGCPINTNFVLDHQIRYKMHSNQVYFQIVQWCQRRIPQSIFPTRSNVKSISYGGHLVFLIHTIMQFVKDRPMTTLLYINLYLNSIQFIGSEKKLFIYLPIKSFFLNIPCSDSHLGFPIHTWNVNLKNHPMNKIQPRQICKTFHLVSYTFGNDHLIFGAMFFLNILS